ncbi:MAG: hypothetical protein KI790_12390 [Cyclobacteriaceae bacterium]|nr:hypothetical protein [Cyclobacteriaceae bacterium HetDA_MAG_MS6]
MSSPFASSINVSNPADSSFFVNEDLSAVDGSEIYYRMQGMVNGGLLNYSDIKSFYLGAGNALAFDGADDYVSIADPDPFNGPLNLSGNSTIEFWVYWNDSTGTSTQSIIDKTEAGQDPSAQYRIYLNEGGSGFAGQIGVWNGSSFFNSPVEIELYEWTHIAIVQSGSNTLFYKDGQFVHSEPFTWGSTNIAPVIIGTDNFDPLNRSFNGEIDEVRLWSVERFGSQIQPTRFRTLAGNESGLALYMRFDEMSGLTVPDLSENRLVGSLTNMAGSEWTTSFAQTATQYLISDAGESGFYANWKPTYHGNGDMLLDVNTASDFSGASVFSGQLIGNSSDSISFQLAALDIGTRYFSRIYIKDGDFQSGYSNFQDFFRGAGNALDFDTSTDDYVDLSTGLRDAFVGTSNITVEAWVNPAGGQSFETIIGNYGSDLQFLFRIDFNKIAFYTRNSTNFSQATGATDIPIGTWTHVAGTWDGTTIRVFVNGIEDGSVAKSGPFISAGGNVHIGGDPGAPGGEFMKGAIDELRVWNRTLTESELQAGQFSTLTGQENGLLAYYRMDEGEANADNTGLFPPEVFDLSGNGYDGTLIGFDKSGSTSNWVPSAALQSNVIPAAPSDLIAYRSSDTEITLNWSDVLGETKYIIERADNFNFDAGVTLIDSVSAGMTSYTFNAGADQQYFYRVSAKNALGTSPGSPVEFATTEAFPGRSLLFDGSSSYMDAGNPTELENTGDLTLTAWVYREGNTTGDVQNIISRAVEDETSADNIHYQFAILTDGTLRLLWEHGSGLNTSAVSSDSVPSGKWVHVAVTRDVEANSTVTFYIDGVQSGQTGSLTNPFGGEDPTQAVWIGANNQLGTANAFYFDGLIDEVQIWNMVISDFSNRNLPLQGNETGLQGYFTFDEDASSSVAYDRSINTNNGALVNGPVYVSSNAAAPAAPDSLYIFETGSGQLQVNWTDQSNNEEGFKVLRAETEVGPFVEVADLPTGSATYFDNVGQDSSFYYRVVAYAGASADTSAIEFGSTVSFPGYALEFDGTNDQVSLPANADIDTATVVTVETWLNINALVSANQAYFGYRDAVGNARFSLHLNPGGGTIGVFSTSDGFNTIPFTWDISRWYHVACVVRDANTDVYVDGSYIGQIAGGYDGAITGVTGAIGSPNDPPFTTEYFNGIMDDVRVWGRTKTDFSDRYSSLQGNEFALISYYSFDAGAGITAFDRSINTYNGTLAADASWVLSGAAAPVAPDSLYVFEVNPGQLQINWNDRSNNAQGFRILRSDLQTGPFLEIADVPSDTFYIDNVTSDTSYYYQV